MEGAAAQQPRHRHPETLSWTVFFNGPAGILGARGKKLQADGHAGEIARL